MGLGQEGNTLVVLIGMLAILFCCFKFIYLVYELTELGKTAYYKNILSWLLLPADFETMMYRPWTIVTYMFIHDGVFNMLGNLLWIGAFGYILQDLAGNRKLIPVFLYCALAIATTTLAPNYKIFQMLNGGSGSGRNPRAGSPIQKNRGRIRSVPGLPPRNNKRL